MRAPGLARVIASRLHEPAIVTALQLLSHTIAVTLGLVMIGAEPTGVTKVLGESLTWSAGTALVVGGATGAAACYAGAWWLERAAIIASVTGYAMLAPAVIITQPMASVVRFFLSLAMLALIVDLLKRYHSIRWAYLDPAPPRG